MKNKKNIWKMKAPWVDYTPMAVYDKFLPLLCDNQKN